MDQDAVPQLPVDSSEPLSQTVARRMEAEEKAGKTPSLPRFRCLVPPPTACDESPARSTNE